MFDFKEILVENDRFMLSLVHIDEGYNGDYEEDDFEDSPLLRFDLSEMVDGEWVNVRDGSACTMLDARSDRNFLEKAAEGMLAYITKKSEGQEEADILAVGNLSWAHLNRKGNLVLPRGDKNG